MGDRVAVPDLERIRAEVAFLPIGGTYTMDYREAAVLAKKLSPKVAVPMHYGFVVGEGNDGERFKREAAPVEVQLLRPMVPFAQ